MTAQKLEETVVQLEALHGAFDDVLTQAMHQLENLTLSDSDVRELSDRLVSESDFRQSIVSALYIELSNNISSLTEEEVLSRWHSNRALSKIAELILNTVKSEISHFVEERIKITMESQEVENAIARKFLEYDAVQSALVVQQAVAKLVDQLPE